MSQIHTVTRWALGASHQHGNAYESWAELTKRLLPAGCEADEIAFLLIRHHYAQPYPIGTRDKAAVWSVTPFLGGGGAECAWSYIATPPLHRRGVLLVKAWRKQWLLNYTLKWTLTAGRRGILALPQFLHKIVVIQACPILGHILTN
jgi:hypothetical protein